MSKHTAPAPELFDTIEYLPLFAGLPVPVVELAPTSERRDPSGPVASWEWAGRLEDNCTWEQAAKFMLATFSLPEVVQYIKDQEPTR